ncbi:MAG TPA: hypothetical protein VIS07_17925 [Candidatus Binatia bacterium]
MLAGALVLLAQGHAAPAWAQLENGAPRAETFTPMTPLRPPIGSSPESVAQQLEALRLELGELRASVQGEVPPPWAVAMQEQLDQRIERMAQMQERLAARIETPTPRLDEPIVLFTVAGCMLLFGFIAGRAVQRRSNRRDLRLRL